MVITEATIIKKTGSLTSFRSKYLQILLNILMTKLLLKGDAKKFTNVLLYTAKNLHNQMVKTNFLRIEFPPEKNQQKCKHLQFENSKNVARFARNFVTRQICLIFNYCEEG